MKTILRIVSFLVCASFVVFCPIRASAQSSVANACAALAGRTAPNITGQVTSGARFPILQQAMQEKRYLKCLQAHGQLTARGAKAAAQVGTFITFDVPGSTCLPRFIRCTHPTAISAAGAITGYYADAIGAMHGFLRALGGSFTNIDPPGSTCPSFFSFCFLPTAINSLGAITGNSFNSSSGFLRAPNGTFTTFDPPGSLYTQPNAINEEGVITGYYVDANFLAHGFLRSRDGTFTTFDAPGALSDGGNGTIPVAINPEGAITGDSFDVNFVGHSFLRARDGTFSTFDPPSAVNGTYPAAINPEEAITGQYCDAITCHGFLRTRGGTFTTIDPPGSNFTGANSINPAGAIVGTYQPGIHGFLRSRDGTFTTVDPTGSIFTWNVPGINPAGVIAGSYIDAGFLEHGFIRSP